MKGLYGTAKAGKYTIVFDAYSFAVMEKDFGAKNINEVLAILKTLQEGVSMGTMLTVLKAGLVDQEPEATQKFASNVIAEVGFDDIASAIGEALSTALPDNDSASEEVGNAKSKPRGRGKVS